MASKNKPRTSSSDFIIDLDTLNPNYWAAKALSPITPDKTRKLELIAMLITGMTIGYTITIAAVMSLFHAYFLAGVFLFATGFFSYTAYLLYYGKFTTDTNPEDE